MNPSSKAARIAAAVVCAVFTAFVLIHLLWAVGITWGLDEVSGGDADERGVSAGLGLTFASLVGAAAGTAAIVVTAARVGWRKIPLSDRMLRIGAWVVFAWPAIGSLNPQTTWGQRSVAVPLALAAFVVARSRPGPRAARASRRPVGRAPVAH